MADYYVKNITNAVTSVSDLGTRVSGTTTTDAVTAYTSLHPAAPGDQLRVVQYTGTVSFFAATATVSYASTAAPAQPAVNS